MNLEEIVQKLPGVEKPAKRQTFNQKLKWTFSVLILYYILTQISVIGLDPAFELRFEALEILMGAKFGSIITLGIGPIVTASIILQLLVGSKIINWDLSTHHGKIMFQGTQKILAVFFSFVEATAYTLFGAVKALPGAEGIVIAQLALGGILIILLDEVISKWGFGSGVSLFIAAGVSQELVVATLSPVNTGTGPAGIIPAVISLLVSGSIDFGTLAQYLLALIATLIVFGIVVYAQSMRVEIPLAFGSMRGFGRKWPLKFVYANVLPVILVVALLINIKVWAQLLSSRGINILGTFSPDGIPQSGLVYYLDPPRNFIWNVLNLNVIGDEVAKVIVYTLFMVAGSIMFSIFWVNTAGMDAKSVARQIERTGMQIPGFRRDPRIIERVLRRYIPALTVLGGAFVGILASFADFMGSIARGTAILLAVMIIYQLYEQLAYQHMEDIHPALRKFIKR